MADLLFPNIAGTAMQAFDQGQQMRANRLIGQAMQSPDQRNVLLGQAGAIDPRLAIGAQGAMQTQEAAQQKAQQGQQDEAAKKLRGAALYGQAAINSKDPVRIAAAQAALAPYLKSLTGKDIGPLDEPATRAAMEQVLAQTAYLDPAMTGNAPSQIQTFKYLTQNLTPADQEKARRVELGLDPRQSSAAIKYMQVLGADGRTRLVAVDPRDVGASIVGTDGTPQGVSGGFGAGSPPQAAPGLQGSTTSPAGNAVKFIFPPGTPPEVIAAAQASAMSSGDLAQGQQIGAPVAQGGALVSPTQAQSAFSTETGKQAAQTAGEQARIPIDAAGEAAKITAKGQATRQLDAPLARQTLTGVSTGYDNMISSVDQILASPGLSRAVGVGSYIPGIRGGSKVDADALITALKSQVGFNVLQNMRDMSKTGGALGQISDKEEELLQNNLAALSTDQSPAQFRQQLMRIRQFAVQSKQRMQGAFDAQYGQQQAAMPGTTVPSPGTVEQGYRFKGGDPSNQANWEPVQ